MYLTSKENGYMVGSDINSLEGDYLKSVVVFMEMDLAGNR
jgi:hypothetical protein